MIGVRSRRIQRGDVFYIRFDNSVGSEQGVGRPGVVISSDTGNNSDTSVYTVALMTTASKNRNLNVPVWTGNRQSYVLCNQIYTYDQIRFGDYRCTLTEKEMAAVDAALGVALGLHIEDNHEEEIAALKAAHAKEIEKIKRDQVESDMYKRLYEKALDLLSELKFSKDLGESEPKVEEFVEEEGPVDINRCEESDLRKLGFPAQVAKMIVSARPYLDVDDLRGVPGVTSIGYRLVEKRITVGDTAEFRKKPKSKQKLLDVNSATFDELREVGFSSNFALNVINNRPYRAKEDIRDLPGMTESVYEAMKNNIKVVPVVDDDRVNINTASAKELTEKAGIEKSISYAITGYRNKNGLFETLDDLLDVPRFTATRLKKVRDKLTV